MRCRLFAGNEAIGSSIKFDPASPADVNSVFHKGSLAAIMGKVEHVVETLFAELELNLVHRTVVHLHIQASELFPLGINRWNYEQHVGVRVLKLV